MNFTPEFDPYDAIVALDQHVSQQRGQILELAKAQNHQGRQITAVVTSLAEVRNEIILLREHLADCMQLQIEALDKLNQKQSRG